MELSQKALKIVTGTFDDIGVPYIKPDAGLFVYTDLRKVCIESTFHCSQWVVCSCFLFKGTHMHVLVGCNGLVYYNWSSLCILI